MDGRWFANTAEVSWLKKKKINFLKRREQLAGKGVPTRPPEPGRALSRVLEQWLDPAWLRPSRSQELRRSGQAGCTACGALFARPARAVEEGSSSAVPRCCASEVQGKPVSGQVWVFSIPAR